MPKVVTKCAIFSIRGLSFAFCEADTPIDPQTWEEMRNYLLNNRRRFPSLAFAPLPVDAASPQRFVGSQLILEDNVSPGNLQRAMHDVLTACGFEFMRLTKPSDWMREILRDPSALASG